MYLTIQVIDYIGYIYTGILFGDTHFVEDFVLNLLTDQEMPSFSSVMASVDQT